jgi:hypothetical protein
MCDMEDAMRDYTHTQPLPEPTQTPHDLEPWNLTVAEMDELLHTLDFPEFDELEALITKLYTEEVDRRQRAEAALAQAVAATTFWITIRNISLALLIAFVLGTLLIYAWAGPLGHR